MCEGISPVWRRALAGRSERVLALAAKEWEGWGDATLGEWDAERRIAAGRFPGLTAEESGWVAWARVRCGFSERRGYCLDEYRKHGQRGREAAKPGIAA